MPRRPYTWATRALLLLGCVTCGGLVILAFWLMISARESSSAAAHSATAAAPERRELAPVRHRAAASASLADHAESGESAGQEAPRAPDPSLFDSHFRLEKASPWGADAEIEFRRFLGNADLPVSELVDLACRTSLCRLEFVNSQEDDRDEILERISKTPSLGTHMLVFPTAGAAEPVRTVVFITRADFRFKRDGSTEPLPAATP